MLLESILQYFQPSLRYHLSLRPLFCLFFEWPLKTGFTVNLSKIKPLHIELTILLQLTCPLREGSCVVSLFLALSIEITLTATCPAELQLPGPEVIKLFSCLTQLSTKFQLLIKTKIPTNDEVYCFKPLRCSIYHANKC